MSLLIREFNRADYQDLHEILSNPKTYEHQSWKIETFDATVKFLNHIKQQDNLRYLVLEDTHIKKIVGACQMTIDVKHNKAEVGYFVHPDHYRKGLATYMTNYMLDHGFNELDLNRIYAVTSTKNSGSIKVLENAGMQKEGIMRQDKVVNGEYRDSVMFSILKDEYTSEIKEEIK